MRIVKWNPQERVDVPDITAQNYLMLGEFRRTLRGAILGEGANYLINGFAVEPNTVPDTTVIVKLDNGGGDLSFAYGAEAIGSRTDYGQVVGGDNSDGNTEGNAQQSLDFTGQPAATYTVQMRFTYADGVNDNRAFWNETTDTEFIAAVNTRTLPQFELRFSGTASPEWIDLADVVWDGVGPIETADITDKRAWAFEGASPWQQTTKLGTGGMPDFSRSSTRHDLGLDAVYPALRGLARQIQDIKGADDSGNWNWWNDPYLPMDPDGSMGRDQSTSLRSLRTVHYTIGDGVSTWGDFNGYALTEGLDECLTLIETADNTNDTMRGHVIIQLLINGDAAADNTFKIGNYDFKGTVVEIRGGSRQKTGVGPFHWGSRIELSGTSTTEAFDVSFGGGSGGLILRDLEITSTNAVPYELARVNTQCHFEMHNCYVNLQGTTSNPVLDIDSVYTLNVSNCWFAGKILSSGGPTNGNGVFRNCGFLDEVRLVSTARLAFIDCDFDQNSYDAGDNLVYIENAGDLWFDRCKFYMSNADNDLIHMENTTGAIQEVWVTNCRLSHFASTAVHTPATGDNGADGTGWHIYIDNNAVAADDDDGRGFHIRGCTFRGSGTVDAGAIFASYVNGLQIIGNEFFQFQLISGGSPSCEIIHVEDATTADTGQVVISGNIIHDWGTTGAANVHRGIVIDGTDHVAITGNVLVGRGVQASSVNYGIFIDDSENTAIVGNTFRNWIETNDKGIWLANGPYTAVHGNTFYNCKAPIYVTSNTTYASLTGNVVNGGNLVVGGAGAFDIGGLNQTIVGNVVNNYNGTYNAFDFSSNGQVFIGNKSGDGIADSNATSGHTGHNETQDVNDVSSYI